MSINHSSRIHSRLPPLDLTGGEISLERSSNGAAAPVSEQTVVVTGVRNGEQNTPGVNHNLAELVWRYFENEIREALQEVQDEINSGRVGDSGHRRKQKGK